MEDILRIIYDFSINNNILTNTEIEKILVLLIYKNNIDKYISNIVFDSVGSEGLASYNAVFKHITIYNKIINKMINDIEKELLIYDDFQKKLYQNLSIIQIILHELEHANQNKMITNENNFETFIIRISNMINISDYYELYESCPVERLAEIKSYKEIINIVEPVKNKIIDLMYLLNSELLKRNLSGYHYENNTIIYPLFTYFNYGNKMNLLKSINIVDEKNNLEYRFKFGMPINKDEYKLSLRKLVTSQNQFYKNKIIVK